MEGRKLIHELLHYLYFEREKMESTGYRVDPDLRKTLRFVNDEIQNLQMTLFKNNYIQYGNQLSEQFKDSSGISSTEKNDAV